MTHVHINAQFVKLVTRKEQFTQKRVISNNHKHYVYIGVHYEDKKLISFLMFICCQFINYRVKINIYKMLL